MSLNFFYQLALAFSTITYCNSLFAQPAPATVYPSGYNHTKTLQADLLWPGESLGLSLTGQGETVYQWEASLGGSSHADTTDSYLIGRITAGDAVSGFSSHATEMARIMIGSGLDSSLQGIAYEASIEAYSLNNFSTDFLSEAPNMKLSLHAYAANYGWSSNGAISGKFWYGLEEIDTLEDYNFGRYNSDSEWWDSVTYANPYLLPVKSVGNDRGETFSGKHYFYKSVGGSTSNYVIDSSTIARGDDGGLDGYDCIPSVSIAKNILTVGAVDFLTEGWSSSSDVVIRPGSAFGPADDGRIKPDLVAGGEKTSQSGAAVSGALLLLREHYRSVKGSEPLASTLKGLLIHTADEAGPYDGPDYKFGWGLLNAQKAAAHISNADSTFIITEDTLTNGDTANYHIYVDNSSALKVSVSWTDPEGDPVPFQNDPSVLDNSQPMLVNDLDIQLTQRKSQHLGLPFFLDAQNPNAMAQQGNNSADNVEVIYWGAPQEGWYTIKLTHKGTLSSSQAYSLLVSGGKTGLVYDGISWKPYAPDLNTGNMDVLIMEGTSVSLPACKVGNMVIEKKARLIVD